MPVQRTPSLEESIEAIKQYGGADPTYISWLRRQMGMDDKESATSGSDEAGTGRKMRTIASGASRTARAANEALVVGPQAAREAKAVEDVQHVIKQGNWEKLDAVSDAHGEASLARQTADSKAKANFLNKGPDKASFGGKAMEKITGSPNYVGQGLGLANYGLQFWENMAEGQGLGEAAFGALGGGWANGQMTKSLFSGRPTVGGLKTSVGWVDTAINLLNSGLKLAGAPDEVTTVTQTVADATPSSFGTSVVSNAGRGLWNLGEGLITGDWEGMKQQGHDLTHGKEGAPLQGYAVTGEALYHGISGDREALDKIREENRSGKRGTLAQWGSKLGRWSRDTQDDMARWVVDNVDFDSMAALGPANPLGAIGGLLGGDDGPSEAEQQKNQADFIAKRDKELADIEKNKEKIMKEQGPQAYYHKMTIANLPPQLRVHIDAA
jgi:hypothetical protein